MDNKNENRHYGGQIKEAGEKVEEFGKELYFRIVSWIKKHPLLTLLFSFMVSVASNLLSQWIWNIFN